MLHRLVCSHLHDHLLCQRGIPSLDFLLCGRVSAREVITVVIVLQEQRFKMSQCVLFTKESPHPILVIRITTVKLCGFEFPKLIDECFVDDNFLVTVHAWSLVLMFANASAQEVRHLEMRIAKEGGDAHNRRKHQDKKSTATVQ